MKFTFKDCVQIGGQSHLSAPESANIEYYAENTRYEGVATPFDIHGSKKGLLEIISTAAATAVGAAAGVYSK